MIWYKAWLENRTRFLISVALIAISAIPWMLFQNQIISSARQSVTTSNAYSGYIHGTVYSTSACFIFLICAILLGFGGLTQERSGGTVSFTLALPLSRIYLVITRASIGLLEIGVLAFLPGLVITSLSPFMHRAYPVTQALQFSFLWFVCGAACFSISFVISIAVNGEYAAPGVSDGQR